MRGHATDQEIGVRMALGAQRRRILRLILWEGMRLVACGLAVGLVASAGLSFILRTVFYGSARLIQSRSS